VNNEQSLSRRKFIGVAVGAGAALTLGAPWPKPAAADTERLVPLGHLGIQLFTVRDKVASLGFLPVFQELASYGYREVEFAGYRAQGVDVPRTQIRQWLDQTGLNGIGTHIGYTQFLTNINQVLDDAEALGLPYVGTANSPGIVYGETTEGYKRAAADFNNFGAAAAARGMAFYQHNHSGEFAIDPTTGIRLYDTILAETDPSLVFFELDIFWAYVGQSRFPGFDPVELVAAQPHRFPLYHVKDGVQDGGPFFGWTMTDVGDGEIDFRKFFTVVGQRGYHHYIVERDTAPQVLPNPPGSFRTAQRSFEYLAGLRA